ncbi:DUF309 domain-containing protein [Bacillus pumilus]|uniref:DUF309 domain-containing protein n=1 Tax=Bacillus TaxID=1386 RepID=UPI00017A64AD|nr:DUF309 domain-containing protein [Bacillus pumilus]EDW21215.1 YpuF [Bacillus pumilus ATCC 7061]MCR4353761.1 DUF309 domain-containing protein [Bacillus pumilus]MCY7504806.1 DUF309 domain-containing protein [Bacillus pumilus]MDR4269825.1 DUF309 domain-containing protein [Bacillus pumilus]MED4627747.1 DUF309 domain-containing protein [Bacillus pumilus]
MYPEAYVAFLHEFHTTRDYFECHEILEEYWKEDPPEQRKEYWVGFIQLAVALYHQRRGNGKGAKRLISNSLHLLEANRPVLSNLGLDDEAFLKLLRTLKKKMAEDMSYESVMLPIKDEALLSLCQEMAQKDGLTFGQESNLSHTFLIEKHRLRDRTDVLLERKKQIERKKSRGL